MLRCLQVGLEISDLDDMNYGDVMDIIMESANDSYKYEELASQEDFDSF